MTTVAENEKFIPALNLIADPNIRELYTVDGRANATPTSIRSVRLEDVFAETVFAKIPGTTLTADELFNEVEKRANWDRIFDLYAPFVNLHADGDRHHVAVFVPLHIRIPQGLADLVTELGSKQPATI